MKRIRRELFNRSPLCHWCGCVTHLPVQLHHPDQATVDHVKPRRECKSVEEYMSPANHVLACEECNKTRDAIDLRRLAHLREREAELKRLRSLKPRVMLGTRRGNGRVR